MNIEPVILLLTFCCLLLTTMITSVIMSTLVVSHQLSQYILKRVIRSVDVLTLCEPVSPFLSEGRKRIVMLLNVGGILIAYILNFSCNLPVSSFSPTLESAKCFPSQKANTVPGTHTMKTEIQAQYISPVSGV